MSPGLCPPAARRSPSRALLAAVEARDSDVVYELIDASVAFPQDEKQAPVALTTLSHPLDAAQEARSKELLSSGLIVACYFVIFTLFTLSETPSSWPVAAVADGSVVTLIVLGVIARRFQHLARAGF